MAFSCNSLASPFSADVFLRMFCTMSTLCELSTSGNLILTRYWLRVWWGLTPFLMQSIASWWDLTHCTSWMHPLKRLPRMLLNRGSKSYIELARSSMIVSHCSLSYAELSLLANSFLTVSTSFSRFLVNWSSGRSCDDCLSDNLLPLDSWSFFNSSILPSSSSFVDDLSNKSLFVSPRLSLMW